MFVGNSLGVKFDRVLTLSSHTSSNKAISVIICSLTSVYEFKETIKLKNVFQVICYIYFSLPVPFQEHYNMLMVTGGKFEIRTKYGKKLINAQFKIDKTQIGNLVF